MKTISNFNRRVASFASSECLNKSKVLKYLKSFSPSWRSAEVFTNPVTGEPTGIDLVAYTDGDWGWDSGETYMFENYDLELNEDFLRHVYSLN